VVLTIDPLTPGVAQLLTISGVTDLAGAHNLMDETNWTIIGPPLILPPIVQTRFEEASGTLAINSGTLGGSSAIVQQNAFPASSINVPVGAFAPAANFASIDFGAITATDGARSIDLTTANGPGGTVGSMPAFTICGWVNARDLTQGPGGNRIVFALSGLNGPGFDLVQLSSGALRLGVNQWPDGGGAGGPFSSVGKITADPLAGANNWVFFAVTYDSAVGGGEARYYFGKPDQAATLDLSASYARGPILTSGTLSAGNFSTVDVPARTAVGPSSRVFRGLMDEFQVFDDALSIEQIQMIQLTTPEAPKLVAVRDGNEIVISWQSPANYQLQYRTNITQAPWVNEPAALQVNGTTRTVRLPFTGAARYYRLQSQ
jgi:hypothetical protein